MRSSARIAAAFAAARDYDGHAAVQRRVATGLAVRIAALPLPPAPRVLEIGCGTGFLTAALRDQGLGGRWLVTDLAPAMVARCRDRLGDGAGRTFAVLDGEHGPRPAAAPFDLICASLAFQWFSALEPAVARLLGWLAPGGHLIFTTLGAGTFSEWRAAHRAEGLAPGTPPFLQPEALADLLPARQAAPPLVTLELAEHADAGAFLRGLKAIGAGTPHSDHRPLPPAALRRVMARFTRDGARATYEVITCHYRSEP
ncbi:methyltransferase domain-containing protein [Novosphingobium piscinae]|uniref:Methyltransferase domain-containing protein n=1 Tax=Novosphingobium piscinae TaxID=1507448 RepID=A0A7X1KR87_9SPHN|nr:methyltransferase domain-containing protein [Novosphingobium piscinae]MBC2670378.1 methyltransferase domain-containing protein [Novosphingobium piscinae]